MPTIPAALLKQIYRRGSLHNDEQGYSFTLRNHLAPAHIVGLNLRVDGVAVPNSSIAVEQVGAAQISVEAPLRFSPNVDTVVAVRGDQLAPGKHKLEITADTREIGAVIIGVSDEL